MAIQDMGEYVRSLQPRLSKNDILTDMHSQFAATDCFYNEIGELIRLIKVNGTTFQNTEYLIKGIDKERYNDPIDVILKVYERILDNQDKITAEMNSAFNSNDIIVSVLDYYQLNLLRYTASLNLFNTFSKAYLGVLLTETLNEKNIPGIRIDNPTFNADVKLVNDRAQLDSFVSVAHFLNLPFDEFLRSIKDLKGHMYNPDDFGNSLTVTGRKLNPHQTGFISVTLNPIYHIRMMILSWRQTQHQIDIEDVNKFKVIVMALQDEQALTSDKNRATNLANQIGKYSNEINKLKMKIEKFEEED